MTEPAVLVTGASRGIGEAIYRRFARDGHRVIGTYHSNADRAGRVSEEAGQAAMLQVDLAQEQSLARMLERLEGEPLRAIVHNAGTIDFEDFAAFDMAIWRRSFAVHCDAALRMATALQHAIVGDGAIVNIASTDAFLAGFDTLSYAASKAALVSLTRSLAVNLGPRGIRANAIAPGWIDTDMGTRMASHVVAMTPLARLGTPEDIAGLAAFLVSRDAAFITGQTIAADGGYYLVDPVMRWEADENQGARTDPPPGDRT